VSGRPTRAVTGVRATRATATAAASVAAVQSTWPSPTGMRDSGSASRAANGG